MFFKKKITEEEKSIKRGSIMEDLFGVTAVDYKKPDNVLRLENSFDQQSLEILENPAIDSTNDDARDPYSDAIAMLLQEENLKQKVQHDYTNETLCNEAEKMIEIIDAQLEHLEKMIETYEIKLFGEGEENEKRETKKVHSL